MKLCFLSLLSYFTGDSTYGVGFFSLLGLTNLGGLAAACLKLAGVFTFLSPYILSKLSLIFD